MKKAILLLLLFPLFLSSVSAQPVMLLERHAVSVNAGVMMNSQTSAMVGFDGVNTETNFIGSLEYKYWFDEEWSVNVNAGMIGAETNVGFNGVSSLTITPVLVGFSYYPEALSLGRKGRVYAGVNGGMYIGSAARAGAGIFSTGATSENVFGLQPFAGVDFFISRYFKIGPQLSYNFVGEFNEVYGKRKDYSGASFAFNFGVVL